MIRITSGVYKGRVLKGGSIPHIRPTMSKVKLSFFDTLQLGIQEKIFLDGFAGTGNIGIEALSRGAEYVVFIDHLPEALALIRHNLEKIGVPAERYRLQGGDFNRSIIHLAKSGFQFDLVYLDPPYELVKLGDPLKVLYKRKVVRPEGMIVLERSGVASFRSPFFHFQRSRSIGREALDYYLCEAGSGEETRGA